ncbi:MAG: glycosyltransferase [Lysobacteraceae bacterium]
MIVHYGDTGLTQRCLDSVLADSPVSTQVLVVDNGGCAKADVERFKRCFEGDERVRFVGDGNNLGFAAACEGALEGFLSNADIDAIALLNNDCEIESGFFQAMQNALDPAARIDMIASRMVAMDEAEVVDSLGIVLYSCGVAANRLAEDETLLGPCGGAALYSTRLLRDLRQKTGQCFEPSFFCYAEDTDLALRASLLGYRATYAPEAVARHVGSASSGGGESEFVMYYGLRNSLSTLVRCMPFWFFVRYGLKLFLLQLMLVAKYLRLGRFRALLRVWRDVMRALPQSLAMRSRLRRAGLLRWRSIADVVDRRFYQQSYLSRQSRLFFGSDTRREKH